MRRDRKEIILSDEAVKNFIAKEKYNEEKLRIYLAKKLGKPFDDPFGVWERDIDEWCKEYINSLPPFDINFEEEYW